MTHEELLATPEYWTTKMQIELYQKVEQYLKDNSISRTEFAKQMGVSKGYISQVLNGDFDHRISKLVELSLAIGYFPKISFEEKIADTNDSKIDQIIAATYQALNNTETGYRAMFYKAEIREQAKSDDQYNNKVA